MEGQPIKKQKIDDDGVMSQSMRVTDVEKRQDVTDHDTNYKAITPESCANDCNLNTTSCHSASNLTTVCGVLSHHYAKETGGYTSVTNQNQKLTSVANHFETLQHSTTKVQEPIQPTNQTQKEVAPLDVSTCRMKAEDVTVVSQDTQNDDTPGKGDDVTSPTLSLPTPICDISYAERLLKIEDDLCESLQNLFFHHPVTHVYNPLIYARGTHSQFVRKYCNSSKPILFLGMNPGPYGMAQNGVPFGEMSLTRDWLGIQGQVGKPLHENPKRPILGFECTHSEVSGKRFWGFFRNLCKTPEVFFKYCYVHNYCPLVFMAQTGKNVTPPTIPMTQRMPLISICDTSLCEVIQSLQVKVIIGVGRFAQDRASRALRNQGIEGIRTEFLMHPSPINAKANKGWDTFAMQQLTEIGVLSYLTTNEK
ncbi:single-strand selective monofunctional uracil DNA glycosylase-like [Glandiceps talaboti]